MRILVAAIIVCCVGCFDSREVDRPTLPPPAPGVDAGVRCESRTLPCGERTCNAGTEYCLETCTGDETCEPRFACQALPPDCCSCDCLPAAADPCATCRDRRGATVRVDDPEEDCFSI
ncbi:MAG: hypothetical protein AAGE52_06150 [Myxococcota bacterium]